MRFDKLAERQILKAQTEGQLDDLKGAGKPLRSDGNADHADAAGFRIMAEAGALPREIELRKRVEEQTVIVKNTADPEQKRRELAKLAEIQLRLDIEQEARRRFSRS